MLLKFCPSFFPPQRTLQYANENSGLANESCFDWINLYRQLLPAEFYFILLLFSLKIARYRVPMSARKQFHSQVGTIQRRRNLNFNDRFLRVIDFFFPHRDELSTNRISERTK